MKFYAVIDTNVLVSFLLTKNMESSVVKVIELVKNETIVPLLHTEIIEEYKEVLRRDYLKIDDSYVTDLMETITKLGVFCDRKEAIGPFPDPDDIVFYEVSLSVDDAYLITGNLKHFPKNGHVVTPAEMLQIIHLAESKGNTVCEAPMEYMSEQKRQIIEKGWQAIEKIRLYAEQNGLSDMPLESINQIIREYRAERKAQNPS
jgi:putative PIN family toxin of toxin-antitoxin system